MKFQMLKLSGKITVNNFLNSNLNKDFLYTKVYKTHNKVVLESTILFLWSDKNV